MSSMSVAARVRGSSRLALAVVAAVVALATGASVPSARAATSLVPAGRATAFTTAVNAPTPGAYTPSTPARILDTRLGLGASRAPLPAGGSLGVTVSGVGGMPTGGIGAVVATVTVTGTRAMGYLTVYPSGRGRPLASTVNWAAGRTVSNTAILPVGPDGRVILFNGSSGAADTILDVEGWYAVGATSDPGTYRPITPVRVRDTRTGVGGPKGPLLHVVQCVSFSVAAGGHTATGASAAAVNVTVTNAGRAGSLGRSDIAPGVIHWAAGETTAHLAVVPLSATGAASLCMSQEGPVDVLIDLVGTYAGGQPASSGRSLVMSFPSDVPTRTVGGGSQTPPGGSVTVSPAVGQTAPPVGQVSAVMLEVTVNATYDIGRSGYLSGRATGAAPVATSLMNWVGGRPESALVILPVGADGSVTLTFSPGYAASLGIQLVGVVLARTPVVSTAWTTTPVPLPVGSIFSGNLSCVSGGVCATAYGDVGQSAHIARRDAGSWHDVVTLPGLSTSPHVGCAGSGLCVASVVVPDGTPTPSSAVEDSTPTTSWTLRSLPASSTPGNLRVNGVGCAPRGTACWSVGVAYRTAADGTVESSPYAAVEDSAGWRAPDVPLPSSSSSGALVSVTCRADDDCLAVGQADGDQSGPLDLAVHWDGARWTDASPSPTATGGRRILSRPSATADGYVSLGWGSGLAHWSAGSWSYSSTPAQGVLSCLTAEVTCFAGPGPTLTRLPGDQAVVATPDDPFAVAAAVADPSCAGTTCVASAQPVAGPAGFRHLVLRLVDGRWVSETVPLSATRTPPVVLAYAAEPTTAVSCWDTAACLLVGMSTFQQPDGTVGRGMDESVLRPTP